MISVRQEHSSYCIMPKKSLSAAAAAAAKDKNIAEAVESDTATMAVPSEEGSWKMDSNYAPRIIGVKRSLGKGHSSYLRQICMFRYFYNVFIYHFIISY